MFLGDNFLLGGIAPYAETFAGALQAQILLPRSISLRRSGVAVLMTMARRRLVEKPRRSRSPISPSSGLLLRP